MNKHRKLLGVNLDEGYHAIDKILKDEYRNLINLPDSFIDEEGFTKIDLMEQTNSLADTICSLNRKFAWGHSKAYFSMVEKQNAEFIAHCLENYYAGNSQFRRLYPELHKEMIKLCETLISEVKQAKP